MVVEDGCFAMLDFSTREMLLQVESRKRREEREKKIRESYMV
jgi:hypothetical protein